MQKKTAQKFDFKCERLLNLFVGNFLSLNACFIIIFLRGCTQTCTHTGNIYNYKINIIYEILFRNF
jgi:hypothetical protein